MLCTSSAEHKYRFSARLEQHKKTNNVVQDLIVCVAFSHFLPVALKSNVPNRCLFGPPGRSPKRHRSQNENPQEQYKHALPKLFQHLFEHCEVVGLFRIVVVVLS